MNATRSYRYVVGIDEVGRGPLAGDAYVGAVVISAALNKSLARAYRAHAHTSGHLFPCKLADSKKLSLRQREAWFAWMRLRGIEPIIARVSPGVIDTLNIARACDRAAQRAYVRVRRVVRGVGVVRVVADGGLSLGNALRARDDFEHFAKADERVPAVSLASIAAKVLRDRAMIRMARRYPHYGFDAHKGYGTKKHIRAIKKYGPSPLHRRSFIKKFV
ncbi:MAG: ribonuclease HII [Candidatus Paceibacterota bacterium]